VQEIEAAVIERAGLPPTIETLLLDETPSTFETLGGLVLLAGVAVTLLRRRSSALGVRRPALLEVGER